MDGLSRTRRWAWGVVIAALCSFAYAKGPGMPHGGGAGFAHGGANSAMGMQMHSGHYAGAVGLSSARPFRNAMSARDPRMPRGANFADANYGDGFGGYKPGMRRVTGPSSGYADGRGHMQYAGAITPVSADARPVPRPPPSVPMRNGSIRADVARYNEERGAARAMQRPSDDPRQPEGSPYRN
ncbi:hypothetical protein F3J20_05155 [Paraburkholderia sp. Cy-641]|uniref:hypothetical protein n=1 Tax=Paraburkholderia sp. Cy-641 TaxID=2608337 RepID=UPI00141E051E|nr:hypothetical protein [Paraburkholderia sp. Cy-641]